MRQEPNPWDHTTYPFDTTALPFDDEEVMQWYPQYTWLADKRQQQQLLAPDAQWGTGQVPGGLGRYIVKPVMNLAGLGQGARRAQAGEVVGPGELWQQAYEGRHFSVDCAFGGPETRQGDLALITAEGIPDPYHFGRFLAWVLIPTPDAVQRWMTGGILRLAQRLPDFRGIINIEWKEIAVTHPALGFIELHLRPSAEFFPLYGLPCVQSLADFAAGRRDTIDPPRGGALLVQPGHGHTVSTLDVEYESSWRASLHYLKTQEEETCHGDTATDDRLSVDGQKHRNAEGTIQTAPD